MPTNWEVPTGPNPVPRPHKPVFKVFVALLGAWLCFPALTSVHVEGFSATLQSIAILLHRHGSTGLKLADQQFPIVTEYLYMTRSGLVDLLQFMMALTGNHSDAVFRAVILISFVGYFLACRHIARKWSGESNTLLILAYLLTPGLVEIAFYFADNLPSAMFAMVGLALIRRGRPTPAWIWACAGACLSLATLIRVDAILTVPAFALGLLLFRKRVWHIVGNTLAFAVGGVVVLLLAQLLTPYQWSDSLQISKMFQNLHHQVESHGLLLVITSVFFGPITASLLLFGAVRNLNSRPWQWNLGLTILPIGFYLYVLPHALEARMFLLLGGPAVLVQAATGLRVVSSWWSEGVTSRRILAATASLFFLGIFLSPMTRIIFHDGPRTLLGRLWSPLIWREWQRSTEGGLRQINEIVKAAQPHETVLVVTGQFNADHYLRLGLLQAGFDLLPGRADGDCASQLETFRNGDRTVLHARSESPYAIADSDFPPTYLQAWEVASELKCAQAVPFTRAELITWETVPEFFLPVVEGAPAKPVKWVVNLPSAAWIPSRHQKPYGTMYLQPLTADQVEQLRVSAQSFAANSAAELSGHRMPDYPQFQSMYRWHFGTFKAR